MLRFILLYVILAAFVFLRLAWPFFRGRTRIIITVLLIPGALFPFVVRWFGGSAIALMLPPALLTIGYFWQITIMVLGFFVAVRDLVSLALWAAKKQPFMQLCCSMKLSIALLAAALLTVGWGEYCALRLPQVDRVTLTIPNLPRGLEGMTIAQISDLHISELFRAGRVQRIAQTVDNLHPELIVITGDWVDGQVADRSGDLLPIKLLKAPLGVWGVEGNHEHYIDYWGWRKFLPTLNVRMLFNQNGLVIRNGQMFYLVGLTDPQAARFGHELPNLPKALEGIPNNAFKILLMHQPKVAPDMCPAGFALQLSGHTHGGQINALYPLVAYGNSGYVRGAYDVVCGAHTMKLYVNQGTDLWNGFPLRLGTHGEITLLTLTAGAASNQ